MTRWAPEKLHPCTTIANAAATTTTITTTPTTTIQPRTTTPNESGSLIHLQCRPQRVITTRCGVSHPFHLQHQPQRPPMSHYNSLGARRQPKWPPTSHYNSLEPLRLRRQPKRPPTSHYDSLVVLL